eukprot:GSChrysophyteH1.ASY1.ANO1.735.1 assembled CDS
MTDTDADVFNKLSRIIATHDHQSSNDPQLDRLAEVLDLTESPKGKARKQHQEKTSTGPRIKLPDRPTPYEVWQAKQEVPKRHAAGSKSKDSKTILSSNAINNMINKMHQSNRLKHDETVRVQNEGLRQELEGFKFKPNINKTSKELAATMKPIAERMPEMVAEKERMLLRKREDREKEELASCAFAPTRIGAKMSDKYLKKMGRSEKSKPSDFFAYQAEKLRRNEQRRQIIEAIESRELIFAPQLPASSRKLHESMTTNPANKTIYDPISRTTTVIRSPRKLSRRNDDGTEKEPSYTADTFRPQISSKGKSYGATAVKVPIHERLYKNAIEKHTAESGRINTIFSEAIRDVDMKSLDSIEIDRTNKTARTHKGKNLLGPALNDLLILGTTQRTVSLAETRSVAEVAIWKSIRRAKALDSYQRNLEPNADGMGMDDIGGNTEFDFSRMNIGEF